MGDFFEGSRGEVGRAQRAGGGRIADKGVTCGSSAGLERSRLSQQRGQQRHADIHAVAHLAKVGRAGIVV